MIAGYCWDWVVNKAFPKTKTGPSFFHAVDLGIRIVRVPGFRSIGWKHEDPA